MKEKNNLQEILLTELCREKRPVTLFLMNGYQLRGQITGFDSLVVVLTSDGKQLIIYKHAISTIAPERPVLPEECREEDTSHDDPDEWRSRADQLRW